MIYSFMLILIGLSLVSMCLSLVQLKIEQLVNDMVEKIKNRRAHFGIYKEDSIERAGSIIVERQANTEVRKSTQVKLNFR